MDRNIWFKRRDYWRKQLEQDLEIDTSWMNADSRETYEKLLEKDRTKIKEYEELTEFIEAAERMIEDARTNHDNVD